jgi:multidrug resistance efflux pump
VAAGAGNRFDLEQSQTSVNELTAQIAAARANERQIREKLAGRVAGELSAVAQVRAQIVSAVAQVKMSEAQASTTQAQLDNAKWELSQTKVFAPSNGTMVNVMLRPGFFVAGMPFNEVMTFVDNEYQIFALFNQNELHQVVPGDEAEIFMETYPGRIIKCTVDSILWATAQGQMPISGNLSVTTPGQTVMAEQGIAVRLILAEKDRDTFLAAGARGGGAIYTEHVKFLHIIRKVFVRVSAKMDWFVFKLH